MLKEKPILFSGPMVRAILDGCKTQTRRVIKPQPDKEVIHGSCRAICGPPPIYESGMRLWIKESHRLLNCQCRETCWRPGMVWYEADQSGYDGASLEKLRPSIHMPRWACRITLEVTGARVERLQDISEADAEDEGCIQTFQKVRQAGGAVVETPTLAVEHFENLWDSINSKRAPWKSNPWVWVISFKVN